MNRRLEERRSEFQQYKRDVRERGKPFYPFAMFHDTVMSLVVVSVIVALACIWKLTADEGSSDADSGWLGKLYDEKADPGTTSFVPRPDWYFFFLFYLLRIFKWPDSVILGTVGVPTIALVLLLAFPFLDLRRERRPLRRPVAVVAAILTVISMGTLTYKGAVAKESLGPELEVLIPNWAQKQGYAGNADVLGVVGLIKQGKSDQEIVSQTKTPQEYVRAIAGAYIFTRAGCASCHTYLGAGTTQFSAPDLGGIGDKSNRGVTGFSEYVADPSKFGNNTMPSFQDLGKENLQRIGTFLQASGTCKPAKDTCPLKGTG